MQPAASVGGRAESVFPSYLRIINHNPPAALKASSRLDRARFPLTTGANILQAGCTTAKSESPASKLRLFSFISVREEEALCSSLSWPPRRQMSLMHKSLTDAGAVWFAIASSCRGACSRTVQAGGFIQAVAACRRHSCTLWPHALPCHAPSLMKHPFGKCMRWPPCCTRTARNTVRCRAAEHQSEEVHIEHIHVATACVCLPACRAFKRCIGQGWSRKLL